MSTYRPVLALLAALGLLATAATVTSGQGAPGVPGVPGLPDIPGVPGQEKARFKVVVEGTASSYAEASGSTAQPTTCSVAIKAIAIDEEVKYGRGRGVTMEFVRLKVGNRQVVSLQRAGRSGDASFAVSGSISRAVGKNGLVTRTPSAPQLEPTCPSVTEKPATRPGCNTTFRLSTDMKFVYGATAGTLRLSPTSSETLGGSSPVAECPESEVAPLLSGLVRNAWPVPLTLPAERLSTRTIFGTRKTFKVVFSAVKPARVEPLTLVLKGTANRYSRHDAIVRFTRLR